jgi:hypothetical protein
MGSKVPGGIPVSLEKSRSGSWVHVSSGSGLVGLERELDAFLSWKPEKDVPDPQRWNRCPWINLVREIRLGLPVRALRSANAQWVSKLLVRDLTDLVERATLLPKKAKAGRIDRMVRACFLAWTFALATDAHAAVDWTPNESLVDEAVLMGLRESAFRLNPRTYRRLDDGIARQALELMRRSYEEKRFELP